MELSTPESSCHLQLADKVRHPSTEDPNHCQRRRPGIWVPIAHVNDHDSLDKSSPCQSKSGLPLLPTGLEPPSRRPRYVHEYAAQPVLLTPSHGP
jgi:hypothetical protein